MSIAPKTIRQAVSVLSGVNRVEVDVARGVVTVDGNYELAAVNAAIADAATPLKAPSTRRGVSCQWSHPADVVAPEAPSRRRH